MDISQEYVEDRKKELKRPIERYKDDFDIVSDFLEFSYPENKDIFQKVFEVGTGDFGFQRVLKSKGINKEDISRDEFLNHAWEWKKQYANIILDQLKKLGLSITTVSRALGGYSDVSEKTRERVKKYANKYQYSPNPYASTLATGKVKTVGYVLPIYGTNTSTLNQGNFFQFISGMSEELLSESIHLQISFAKSEKEELKAYEKLIEAEDKLVSGQIFNAGWENKSVNEIAQTVKNELGEDISLVVTPTSDNRSYHISSEKIKKIRFFQKEERHPHQCDEISPFLQ